MCESYPGLTFSGSPCWSKDTREAAALGYLDWQRERAARSCARVRVAWYPLPTSASPVASRLGLQHGQPRFISSNSRAHVCNAVFLK
jgi:hypothetical protein